MAAQNPERDSKNTTIVCTTCAALSLHILHQPGSRKELHILLDDLARDKDATACCATCSMLLRAVLGVVGALNTDRYLYLSFTESEISSIQGPLRVDLWPRVGGTRRLKLQFYTHFGTMSNATQERLQWSSEEEKNHKFRKKANAQNDAGNPSIWPSIGAAGEICNSAASDACFSLISQWLSDCDINHPNCPPPAATLLPTRIIDVGSCSSSRAGSEAQESHLHISTPGEQAKYIALSHCWGGKSPVMTTTKTLAQHTVAIPFASLPRTFQDAVTVTRRLGIQFLWIDSLCIIQDSAEDWAREAGRMASVYEHAAVTIAADAAEDSTTGFLDSAQRRSRLLVAIPCPAGGVGDESSGTSSTVYVREKGAIAWNLPFHGYASAFHRQSDPFATPEWSWSTTHHDEDGYSSARPISRLSTRGWVLQERLLSPRTLHFASEELAFECRTIVKCECSEQRVRTRQTGSMLKASLVLGDWEKIVEEYTTLTLTRETDILAALSGLAEYVSRTRALGDRRYVCGMWERDLLKQLLWKSVANSKKMRGRRTYGRDFVAPTWSWASVKGEIAFPTAAKSRTLTRISESLRVVDTQCELESALNPFGSVKSARLTLRGIFIPVRLSKDNPSYIYDLGAYPIYHRRHHQDERPEEMEWRCLIPPDRVRLGVKEDEGLEGGWTTLRYEALFFLVFGISDASGEHHGLILGRRVKREKDDQDEPEVYERVGYAVWDPSERLRKLRHGRNEDSDRDEEEVTVMFQPAMVGLEDWSAIGQEREVVIL